MIHAGQRFDFNPRKAWEGSDDLRPVDLAVARWVMTHGGDARVAKIAAEASLADGRGDSALRLEDHSVRDALVASPLVGDAASDARPFVIDGDLFYLRRNFLNEIAVAGMLKQRLHAPRVDEAGNMPLDGLFDDAGGLAQAGQVDAVRKALDRRFFVLTGGPGTGKTTTVLRLLMAASRNHKTQVDEWPRIMLAAPTGKAAQRLGESLRNATLSDFPSDWHDPLTHVQAAETGTLHRLLGSRGTRGGFARSEAMPLDADIVVVDEASMLDLALLRALLSALKPEANLVLVGDADQLDSVGTGSVLQDIVAALEGGGPHLQRLQHAYRADVALRPLNESVRSGDLAAFRAAWAAAGDQAAHHPLVDAAALTTRLDAWSDGLLADYRANGMDQAVDQTDAHLITQWLRVASRKQSLCALREGAYGAAGLNAAIESRLGRVLQGEGVFSQGESWYPGRRILITRNDAASGLFNGDVGLCLLDTEGRLRVWFPGGDGQPRSFDTGALPPHEPAFAMTVHKSQGSECDEVAVLLPPQPEHPLLSRQWFYTAISRARKSLHVWGSDAALAHAIDHPARRNSGLSRRILADSTT